MLGLPEPLRGQDDRDQNGFTFDSIHRRLPLIVDEVIEHNGGALPAATTAALRQLQREIRQGDRLFALSPEQPDPSWERYSSEHEHETWLSSPWFYCENYFYRRIQDAITAHGGPADPYASQKMASLESSAVAFTATVLPLALQSNDPRALLIRSLWGNRADLSLHTVAALASHQSEGGAHAASSPADEANAMLVDDIDSAVALLRGTDVHRDGRAASGGSVAIILDNCGLELLADLALAAGLLRLGLVGRVTLWAKRWPVFVSDAMPHDVETHIQWLEGDPSIAVNVPTFIHPPSTSPAPALSPASGEAQSLASQLRAYVAGGRLVVRDHPFLTGPRPYWDMPADLAGSLAEERLVIVKGDANYRRLLGDRHWPHDAPFASVTRYFPAPLLALRTCKSGLAVGLSAAVEARAVAARPHDWLTSGHFGLAQVMAQPQA